MRKLLSFLQTLKQQLVQISKRQRLILAAAALAFILFTMQVTAMQIQLPFILFLAFSSAVLSAWALHEDIAGIEWLTLLTLPVMYSVSVGLSYYLLPPSWNMRFLVAGIYAFTMYGLLLTENIYNVAAMRTIELLRAATAIGFLLTLLTAFLLFNTIFSFHLGVLQNTFLIFLVTCFLVLQNVWSIELEPFVSPRILLYTLTLGLVAAEVSFSLSFWPSVTTLRSIFIVAVLYVVLGITYQIYTKRPTMRTNIEYIVYGILVLLGMILATRWSG